MRKSKPYVSRKASVISSRTVIPPIVDGVMSVPISNEHRSNADQEMKDYIKRYKQKESADK